MLVCVELVGIHVEILCTGNTGGTIQSLKEYSETRVALQNSVVALIFTRRLYFENREWILTSCHYESLQRGKVHMGS